MDVIGHIEITYFMYNLRFFNRSLTTHADKDDTHELRASTFAMLCLRTRQYLI